MALPEALLAVLAVGLVERIWIWLRIVGPVLRLVGVVCC